MQVYFWGTRGSLPTSLDAGAVRKKIRQALAASRGLDLSADEALESFIDSELPFAVRGTYGGNTPCVEIRGGDEYVICDCGSGLRDLGMHLMSPEVLNQTFPPRVFNIFMSHFHWDHLMGFPFFTPAYIPGNTVNVFSAHENPRSSFEKQQMEPNFPVSLDYMGAEINFHAVVPGSEMEVAGFRVTAFEQNHPGGSFGYRFRRDGKTVVYSSDAEHKKESEDPDYPYLDFVRGADLLIFDAQYPLADAVGMKEDWGHSSNILAVELSVRAEVKRVLLFHLEHTATDEQFDQFLAETRDYLTLFAPDSPLQIDMAYDGFLVDLT